MGILKNRHSGEIQRYLGLLGLRARPGTEPEPEYIDSRPLPRCPHPGLKQPACGPQTTICMNSAILEPCFVQHYSCLSRRLDEQVPSPL